MSEPISLKAQMKRSILKQSAVGAAAIAAVLFVVAFFIGRYQASLSLEEVAISSAKAYRSQILEGDIKAVESQLADLLKLRNNEFAVVLNSDLRPIYHNVERPAPGVGCKRSLEPCVPLFGGNAEILVPLYFDQDAKKLSGYLFLSKALNLNWLFLGIVFIIFGLGYATVFFGVTRITKTTMLLLASSLEDWSNRLSTDPKDAGLLSSTPYQELLPLKCAIEGLNRKIAEYESSAAEKAKLLILRGIAHDLEGPLAQAQLYLGALKKKSEDHPAYSGFVANTMDSINEVSQVASQVKLLKELPSHHDSIELGAEATRALDELRTLPAILDKNIELDLAVSERDVSVSLSRIEFKRILQNLVQNSADASAANSKIEVEIKRDGVFGVLSVRDHGHGIAEEHREKVFQPDFTLKPGTGTGLGLAVVSTIAAARNGSVRLESSQGGTQFDLRFPVREGVQYG